MAIEMEHVVEVRPIGQDAGQLFQRGRAQDIELDAVVVRADQFEQRTGDRLERYIPVATGTADDHEDIKSLCRSWRTGWLENQIRLTAHKGIGKAGEVTILPPRRIAHQFPGQGDALWVTRMDNQARVGEIV